MSELDAVIIENNDDKLEVFLPGTTELLLLPVSFYFIFMHLDDSGKYRRHQS